MATNQAVTAPAFRTEMYDNPGYVDHKASTLAAWTAGSGNASGKWIAYTNAVVYGIDFSIGVVPAGTSTYTQTITGTATTTATAAQVSVIWVTNTSTVSGGLSLTTNTLGPFVMGGSGAAQNAVGGYWRFTLQTASQTGGFAVQPGDQVYVVNGTDGSFVATPILEWQKQYNGPDIA